MFFLLLAPSSSFVPVASQTMAEHRMYLALAVPVGLFAIGVATGVALACVQTVTGIPLHWCIGAGFAIIAVQSLTAPRAIVPLAYDSGGVSTTAVTVPIVTALGLGLAEFLPDRNPLLDGFGLIAFACLFPPISVLAYAQVVWLLEARVARKDMARHDNRAAAKED